MSNDNDYFLDSAGISLDDGPADSQTLKDNVVGTFSAAALATRSPDGITRAADGGGQSPLYFDLETIPDYARLDSFPLDPVPPIPCETDPAKLPDIAEVVKCTADGVKLALRKLVPPHAWLDQLAEAERAGKDRSGVHGHISDARDVRGDAQKLHSDRLKLLSTTPEYCSIAAMGFAVGSEDVRSLVVGLPDPEYPGDLVVGERYILDVFWSLVSRHSPLVVFNGLHFDLPVILVRSAILGVPSSRVFDLRPWGKDIVDPYHLRFGSQGAGSGRPGKLKLLAPLYGIEVPAGDCEGSQVDALMKSNPSLVGDYVRSDVEVLRNLHRALAGFFWR